MSAKRSLLTPVEGFAPAVGICLAAMDEVRSELRDAVEGLPDDVLAKRAFPGAHSIGALVLHIGEAEWWWMHCVVGSNPITDEDRLAVYWDALIKEGRGEDFAARGLSARECLAAVDEIRKTVTYPALAALTDDGLDRIICHEVRGKTYEDGLRWVLHHLVVHESQHKGQILMLKRILGK